MRHAEQKAVILMNGSSADIESYTTALCVVHVEVAMRPLMLV